MAMLSTRLLSSLDLASCGDLYVLVTLHVGFARRTAGVLVQCWRELAHGVARTCGAVCGWIHADRTWNWRPFAATAEDPPRSVRKRRRRQQTSVHEVSFFRVLGTEVGRRSTALNSAQPGSPKPKASGIKDKGIIDVRQLRLRRATRSAKHVHAGTRTRLPISTRTLDR